MIVQLVLAMSIGQLPAAKEPPAVRVLPMVQKTYQDYRDEAIAASKPIVIFVRCEPREIKGCVTCRVDHLDGYESGPNIVLGAPDAKLGQRYVRTLPANASDAAIRQALGLEVTQTRSPFFKRLQDRRQDRLTADDKPNARQLPDWFPKDAVRYSPAKWTQMAYKTATSTTPWNTVYSFPDGGRLDKWPIALLDAKWKSPGGLENAHGWKSDRYKFLPSAPVESVAPVSIQNGILAQDASDTGRQSEQVVTRKYVDGSWFADVLSNDDGNVFEIRVAEKEDGEWRFYVAHRNADNRPRGYAPVLASACVRCHGLAGVGSYAAARNPGGDMIFSDPFSALEK